MTLSMRCTSYRNERMASSPRNNIHEPLSTWRSTRPARTRQVSVYGGQNQRPVVRAPVQEAKTRVLSIDGGGVRGLIPGNSWQACFLTPALLCWCCVKSLCQAALVLLRVEETLKELISQGVKDGLDVEGLENCKTELQPEDFEVDLADYFTVFAGGLPLLLRRGSKAH